MVVKKHLDAGPYMEGSMCVLDGLTELHNQGIYAPLNFFSIIQE